MPSNQRSVPPPLPKGASPWMAYLAAAGLAGIVAVVCTAMTLRSEATIDELVRAADDGSIDPIDTSPSLVSDDRPEPVGPDESNPKDEAPEAPEHPKLASEDEIDEAEIAGLGSMRDLAKMYPGDARVLRKLVLALSTEQAHLAEAIVTLRKLFRIAPKTIDDKDLEPVILRAANGPPEVANKALELMATNMKSAGPDLLYKLLTAKDVGEFPKGRAEELLGTERVRKLATAALVIALDLRAIKAPCSRNKLLKRAQKQGDMRALQYLHPMTAKRGCGFLNLDKCLMCGSAIAAEAGQAIKAIQDRSAQ